MLSLRLSPSLFCVNPLRSSPFSHSSLPSFVFSQVIGKSSFSSCFQQLFSNPLSGLKENSRKFSTDPLRTVENSLRVLHETQQVKTRKKTNGIFLFLFLGSSLLLGKWIYEKGKPRVIDQAEPVAFSKLEGMEWVQECLRHHPEIFWLTDNETIQVNETANSAPLSYSQRLFAGKKFIEFDQTLAKLYCLKLIFEGSDDAYQKFTQSQPDCCKLSRESFDVLHFQGKKVIDSCFYARSNKEIAEALAAAIVLGDLKKSRKGKELILFDKSSPFGFKGGLLEIFNQRPQLAPSFARLHPVLQKLLLKVDGDHVIDYDEIMRLEGEEEIFEKVKRTGLTSGDLTPLSFSLFLHFCRFAGSAGNGDPHSSPIYTEIRHLTLQGMRYAIKLLSNPEKSEKEVYETFLGIRTELFGLNPKDKRDRAHTKIGAMLGLTTPKEADDLKKSVEKLELDNYKHLTISVKREDKEFDMSILFLGNIGGEASKGAENLIIAKKGRFENLEPDLFGVGVSMPAEHFIVKSCFNSSTKV